MNLDEFISIVEGRLINKPKKFKFSVSVDTRTIKKNDIFIPIKYKEGDGNKYILEASKCASILLIPKDYLETTNILEEVLKINKSIGIIEVDDGLSSLIRLAKYKRSKVSGKVIVITGSNGKTSTKEMLSTVLNEKYKVFKSYDNYNNILGVSLNLLNIKNEEVLIFEVGMNHLGEISEISKILKPDIAVITNIGTAHIGNLKSKKNILKAKLEVMDGFNIDSKLFINDNLDIDNKYVVKCKIPKNKVLEDKIILDLDKEVILKLKGYHNVYSISLALEISKYLGLSIKEVIKGLKKYKNYRMKEYIIDNSLIIDDSYNSNLESVINGIEYLKLTHYKNKILVLGDIKELGKYTKSIHKKIGKYIDRNIFKVYTYGEYSKYISDINHYMNMENLIEDLRKELKEDTIIYIKGSHSMNMSSITKALLTKNT